MLNVQRSRVSAAGMTVVIVVALLMSHGEARAQPQDARIGPLAVDVRLVLATYGPTTEQAAVFGYDVSELPSVGLGLDIGGHWYPVHWNRATLGVGGNIMLSAGHSRPSDADGAPTGRNADTRLSSVASQVSLNFGTGAGWSYLSGGLGFSIFTIATKTSPAPDNPAKRMTINFGGGARWSLREHVLFCFDLRFYRIAPQTATELDAAAAGTTRVVLGAGFSFK